MGCFVMTWLAQSCEQCPKFRDTIVPAQSIFHFAMTLKTYDCEIWQSSRLKHVSFEVRGEYGINYSRFAVPAS
jgi:hypothetical protein